MGSNVIEGSPGSKGYVPPEWQMPKPYVGMTVLWSYNRDSDKSPATIVKVGSRAVEVLVHVASMKDHVIKTGVRHVDDPFLLKFPQHDGGCWQWPEWETKLWAIVKNFEDIDEPGE